MKQIRTVTYLLVIFLLVLIFVGLSKMQKTAPSTTRKELLALCTGHAVNNIHYHAQLAIVFKNEPYTIPAFVGINKQSFSPNNTCIHPVHTHDTTGLIHVDYPRKHPFTIGDFFKTWGIIFSKDQLASMHTYDKYSIAMTVNGVSNFDFEKYILKDQDKIVITIRATSATATN